MYSIESIHRVAELQASIAKPPSGIESIYITESIRRVAELQASIAKPPSGMRAAVQDALLCKGGRHQAGRRVD